VDRRLPRPPGRRRPSGRPHDQQAPGATPRHL